MFKKVFMSLALSLFLAAGFGITSAVATVAKDKTTICHKTGSGEVTITVANASLLQAHYEHGDHEGACSGSSDSKSSSKSEDDSKDSKSSDSKSSDGDKESLDDTDTSTSTSSCVPPAGTVCVCDAACYPATMTTSSESKSDDGAKDGKSSDKSKSDDGAKDGKSSDKSKSDDGAKDGKSSDKSKSDDGAKDGKSSDKSTSNSAPQGVVCTCIDGTSGYLFNSTGPNGAKPTLTPVPPRGIATGSGSGSSFREISGK